jgi:endonuclease YncB( thermonuclease family)
MADEKVEWAIPRLGIGRSVPRHLIALAYGIVALGVVSGLVVGSFARVLVGIALLGSILVGLNAYGLRKRARWLEASRRPLTGQEWAAVGVGTVLFAACVVMDFGGMVLLAFAGLIGFMLLTDTWRMRNRIPLLNSPDRQTARLGWAGAWLLGLVLLVVLSAPRGGSGEAATVLRVVDGDTLDVQTGSAQDRVRIIGLNTPENGPSRGVECYGPEASAQAQRLLSAKTVRLESDPSQDERDFRGRRLLFHVWLPDGRLYAETMIRDGYAREATYAKPYKYQREYREAQARAQAERRGLWGACASR